ncbi:glycosyltransferase [Winogradskyella sp. DF17]|uniref:Glycosyltransferase n=2 Tax=Winogradskyella pelagia TaxID=2819984 RepID=A0ABS3T479_9FLAO|nr:glycosyltransferase [Winogradskyella sp. DF17]
MNIWTSHFKKVLVVGNYSDSEQLAKIDISYDHPDIDLVMLPKFNIKTPLSILRLCFNLPTIIYRISRAMMQSDYLHLRCPSNVSAIAAVIQIFFPKKPKSTKYAGNWNPTSKQPLGYRFQKWILSNTVLTKRMKLLVYGEWPNQSPNVSPFLSATYYDCEKVPFKTRDFNNKIKFVFIGAMVIGKRPMLAIEIILKLRERGYQAELHMFGDGDLMTKVLNKVKDHNMDSFVFIHGNQNKAKVKECLVDAHFTILPSKSEGWPKAIAEGMFFGAIPISTRISCLPWILDNGKRGILIDSDAESAITKIDNEIAKGTDYLNNMAEKALLWSQNYTIDRLENEIQKILEDA